MIGNFNGLYELVRQLKFGCHRSIARYGEKQLHRPGACDAEVD
ncbi:hypothetical protein SAMN05216604_102188 [Pseudomonas agarici]|nr:hypothetical protein SAMN05216604_102188 [Pseudomonas agarici]